MLAGDLEEFLGPDRLRIYSANVNSWLYHNYCHSLPGHHKIIERDCGWYGYPEAGEPSCVELRLVKAAVLANRLGVLKMLTGLIRGREEFPEHNSSYNSSLEKDFFTKRELMSWLFEVEVVDESGPFTMRTLAERGGRSPMVEWIEDMRSDAAADSELFKVRHCRSTIELMLGLLGSHLG